MDPEAKPPESLRVPSVPGANRCGVLAMSRGVALVPGRTDPRRTLRALPPGSGWYLMQASSHPSEDSLAGHGMVVDLTAEVMRGVALRLGRGEDERVTSEDLLDAR